MTREYQQPFEAMPGETRAVVRANRLQRFRAERYGTCERQMVRGAARLDRRRNQSPAADPGDALSQSFGMICIHAERQVWPMLLNGAQRDHHRCASRSQSRGDVFE